MNRFPRLLAALALASTAAIGAFAPASAQSPTKCAYLGPNCIPDVSDYGVIPSGSATPQRLKDLAAVANNAQQADVPVCSGGYFPGGENGATATSSSVAVNATSRHMMWCPKGAKYVRFLFTNGNVNSGAGSTNEGDGTNAIAFNLGVEANAPAPWSTTANYAVGQTVSYWQGEYTAVVANAGQVPTNNTAYWTLNAAVAPSPVTCFGGSRTCQVGTHTTPTGTVLSDGSVLTDPVLVNIPAGGWLALYEYMVQPVSGAATIFGPVDNLLNGEFAASYAGTLTDQTLTGGFLSNTSGQNGIITPIAAIGQPQVTSPSVCVVMDSEGAAVTGYGLGYINSFAGGSGFTSADVGKVGTMANTGGSSGAVAQGAQFIIATVSGGAVTNLLLVNQGAYENPSIVSGQTLPNGSAIPVNFTGVNATTGSGVTVNVAAGNYYGNGHDVQAPGGGGGYITRALNALSIPHVLFVRGGDLISNWVSRDYTRLNGIRQSGCSTVYVGLGLNDLPNGYAGMLTNAQKLAAQLHALPNVKAVIWGTLTPYVTTSTDGYLAANGASQTPNAVNGGARLSFNTLLRSKPSFLDGYVEVGNCPEATPDSGIFKTDGVTVGLTTIDGLHYPSVAQAALAACVAPLMQTVLR